MTIIDKAGGGSIVANNESESAVMYVGGSIIFGSKDIASYNNFTVCSDKYYTFSEQCQNGSCTIYGGTFKTNSSYKVFSNLDYPNLIIYGGVYTDDSFIKYMDPSKDIQTDGNNYRVVDKKKLASPDGLFWNVKFTKNNDCEVTAKWDAVDNEMLGGYKVYAVFKNGDTEKTTEEITTTDTSSIFNDFFNDNGEGTYSFYVKAFPKDETILESELSSFSQAFHNLRYDLEVTNHEDDYYSPCNLNININYANMEIMNEDISFPYAYILVPHGSEVYITTVTKSGYYFNSFSYNEGVVENLVKDDDLKTISFTLTNSFAFKALFTKDDAVIRVNLDIGEKHEELAQKIKDNLFKAPKYSATIDGSVISISYEKASNIYNLTNILERGVDLMMHYNSTDRTYNYGVDTFIDNDERHYYYEETQNEVRHFYPVFAEKKIT